MRWLRCLVAAVVAEIAAIIVLVLIVAVVAPRDPAAAQAYAEGAGRFAGPLAGALFGMLGGYFVARPLRSAHLKHGAFFGVLFAMIDLALVALSGAPFEPLFVASSAGRVVGGLLGARLAGGRPATT